MAQIVRGRTTHPFLDELLTVIKNSQLLGVLYTGYPVVGTVEGSVTVDALLVSPDYGLVIFRMGEGSDHIDWPRLAEETESTEAAIVSRLLEFQRLRSRRQLLVPLRSIWVFPTDVKVPVGLELTASSPRSLVAEVENGETLDAELVRPLLAAIQRVSSIKPPNRRPNVSRDDSKGGVIRTIEREIANLDEWQNAAAIEMPEGPQRVRGLAGSGKTIVLALKAAYLHASYPDWTIAVTFYTRSLYQQFEDLIRRFYFAQMKDEPNWQKLQILHAWGSHKEPGVYSQCAESLGAPVRDFREARELYRGREFERICSEVLESIGEGARPPELYNVVLIDEGQDFPQPFFEMVYHFTKSPKRVVWAYDELQNLNLRDYHMEPPEVLFGSDQYGRPRVHFSSVEDGPREDLVLPVCYRNPPWTLVSALAVGLGIYRADGLVQMFDEPSAFEDVGYRLVKGEFIPNHMVTLKRDEQASPEYFDKLLSPSAALMYKTFASARDQAIWVANSISSDLQEEELNPSDFLIIFPEAVSVQKDAVRLISELRERGVNCHITGVTSSRDLMFIEDSVAITGPYRAKGNEAPVVYLLNSEYCFSGPELLRKRNILFTAMTRSRAWLCLCGVGDASTGLKEELDLVKEHDFQLEFRFPTEEESAHMRRVHADLKPETRKAAERAQTGIADFVRLVATGEMLPEALPSDLLDQLEEALEKRKRVED